MYIYIYIYVYILSLSLSIYIYVYMYIYMYIYICMRTNGVNNNGAAAKVADFDGLRKRYALALLGI